jgi:hypothetical protein
VIAAEASPSAADAEVNLALKLLDRTIPVVGPRKANQKITLGADTGYQEKEFLNALRKREVAPHVSEYVKGNLGRNSLTEAEGVDEHFFISQRKRKSIERVFGWSKLDRPLLQIKQRGLKRVDWFYRLTIAAYNLVGMRRLISIETVVC